MALLTANAAGIQGLGSRFKNIMLEEMKNQDSPQRRKEVAEKESAKIKKHLVVAPNVVENVFEGYDPNLNTGEITDKYLLILVNTIMDHNPETDTEEQFMLELKKFL